MTVYIDLIFLENLFLNYIILMATCLMRKTRIRWIKIFIASVLGSICSILNYIIELNYFQNTIFKLLTSVVMILIAYDNPKKIVFFKNIMFFYLVSLTFGGASFMFLFIVKPKNIVFDNGHFVGTYPIKMAILGGSIGLILVLVVSKIIKDKFKNIICDLEIVYNGKMTKIKALVDSR